MLLICFLIVLVLFTETKKLLYSTIILPIILKSYKLVSNQQDGSVLQISNPEYSRERTETVRTLARPRACVHVTSDASATVYLTCCYTASGEGLRTFTSSTKVTVNKPAQTHDER